LSEAEREERLRAGRSFSWRLRVAPDGGNLLAPEFLHMNDLVMGRVEFTPEQAAGDFALYRSDGVFAYQLAVVLDDIAMGVNQVVRGADIIHSTPRQLYLYSLLGAVPPAHAHIPLLLDHQGERLAKRHASISLRALRQAGVRPQAVVGWLAVWAGLAEVGGGGFQSMNATELLPDFSFRRINAAPERLPADIAKVLGCRTL
jgi:glutamyl-tRNA synthetase